MTDEHQRAHEQPSECQCDAHLLNACLAMFTDVLPLEAERVHTPVSRQVRHRVAFLDEYLVVTAKTLGAPASC